MFRPFAYILSLKKKEGVTKVSTEVEGEKS